MKWLLTVGVYAGPPDNLKEIRVMKLWGPQEAILEALDALLSYLMVSLDEPPLPAGLPRETSRPTIRVSMLTSEQEPLWRPSENPLDW